MARGRDRFKSAVEEARQTHYNNITKVRISDEGFTFDFIPATGATSFTINVNISEHSAYPDGHLYMIYADEGAPPSVASAFEEFLHTPGRTVSQLLSLLSISLTSRTASGGRNDPHVLDSDGDTNIPDSSQFDEELDGEDSDPEEIDNEGWAMNDAFDGTVNRGHARETAGSRQNSLPMSRARSDLRAAKVAGFKVGHLGLLQNDSSCYLSVSCRVAKLGISEEVMQAWLLQPSNYLILLIYYLSGYRSLDFLESHNTTTAQNHVEMRVGISNTYKPISVAEAQHMFGANVHHAISHGDNKAEGDDQHGLRDAFISRPLNDLLNKRLISILKYRLGMGLSWSGAEYLFNESQGRDAACSNYVDATYSAPDEHPPALPKIVMADEIKELKKQGELSFPLIAMQFLLRHFVRCTEFCLVCHCALETKLDALKPYVCDKPLCLYQYMSLGFGPSIEHEIIAQPYVVDLLISFCYAGTASNNKCNYPEGLGLNVPHPSLPIQGVLNHHMELIDGQNGIVCAVPGLWKPSALSSKESAHTPTFPEARLYDADLNQISYELSFNNLETGSVCPLKISDWIVINIKGSPQMAWHCRVRETVGFPKVSLSEPLIFDKSKQLDAPIQQAVPSQPVPRPDSVPVNVHVYKENFDDLEITIKARTMRLLLDLLPSVSDMRNYLTKRSGNTLTHWANGGRICPASLELLRWIIASNRSCIVQVDQPDSKEGGFKFKTSEERVQGLTGLMQFRFAMGAPDKEQRFVNSIKEVTGTATYPTMFAWHGSPLGNWHSIIREGLTCSKIAHGRAYGNGCYHANDYNISMGYTGGLVSGGYAGRSNDIWPQSALRIGSAIALSEIVNAPDKFRSSKPYYVVEQLDWIQTRYLFVVLGTQIALEGEKKIERHLPQDPLCIPRGPKGHPIVLPITAVPKSRRPIQTAPSATGKKKKLTSENLASLAALTGGDLTAAIDQDAASVMTEIEDLEILFEPDDRPATPTPSIPGPIQRAPSEPMLPFDCITLGNLPLLPPPPYATTMATQRLQREFRTFQKLQQSHIEHGTLHEFGLYIDPEHLARTENLYQWIAELHSFPLSLPIAQDMQGRSTQSVVIELRFHKEYPQVPPFVRVIRPRFLPFASGGGGNVTAGGSICMDLLTNTAWSPVYDVENVLLQIRVAIMSSDPRPARLEQSRALGRHGGGGAASDYGVGEAVDAFKRAAAAHGWEVPRELTEMAYPASRV